MEVEQKPKRKPRKQKESKIPNSTLEKFFVKQDDESYQISEPPNMTPSELGEMLRKELSFLDNQIRDLELRRTAAHEKYIQVQKERKNDAPDKNDKQFILSDMPKVVDDFLNEFGFEQYFYDNNPLKNHITSQNANQENIFLISQNTQIIDVPQQKLEVQQVRENLWKYFNYSEDLKKNLQDVDSLDDQALIKLAEYFGLKTKLSNKNDFKKLKISLNEILKYCEHQEFSEKIKRLYKPSFLLNLELK